MKKHINNIEYLEKIIYFDDLGSFLDEDDYFLDNEEFEWWNQLSKSIKYLEDNNIEAEVNELEDYIVIAKENGFNN